MIRCLSCGAETSNGLALCALCQRFTRSALEHFPIYFTNLSRWKPGRAWSRSVPGSRVLYDGETSRQGTGDRISDRLDEAANMLTTWARALVKARPHLGRLLDRLVAAREAETIDGAQVVAWLCKGFAKFLPSVATLEWAGEFTRDLAVHEEALRRLTESYVPGWYAGSCKRCSASVYVVPGLTWVTCTSCGATTHAGDHRERILDEARSWVARPRPLAEAIVALVDTEQSVRKVYDRIRWWASQGELAAIRHSGRDYTWDNEQRRAVVTTVAVGHARYRMGDALDLVLRDTRSLSSAHVS